MSNQDESQPVQLTPLVAVYSQIPSPAQVNMKGNLADNWKFLKKSWNNFKVTTGLDKKEKNVVLATLYTVLGKEANQIAENLDVTDPTEPESYRSINKLF